MLLLGKAIAAGCTILPYEGADAGSIGNIWEWPEVAILLLILW